MRRECGSLLEYIIPTAIVGLALGLGLFYIWKEDKLTTFISASAKMRPDKIEAKGYLGEEAYSPGFGTPKLGSVGSILSPGKLLINNKWFFDYEEFGLYAIPQDCMTTHGNMDCSVDIGDFGCLKVMSNIIYQLAGKLASDNEPDKSKEMTDFADLIEFMAEIEQKIATQAYACEGDPDPDTCLTNKLQSYPISLPTNLSSLLPNFTSDNLYNLRSSLLLGNARAALPAGDETKDLNVALVKLYDQIMSNPEYSANMKHVIDEVYNGVSQITCHSNGQVTSVTGGGTSYACTNPVTGTPDAPTDYSASTLDTIQHPGYPINFDLIP